jgi:hypothetical protein
MLSTHATDHVISTCNLPCYQHMQLTMLPTHVADHVINMVHATYMCVTKLHTCFKVTSVYRSQVNLFCFSVRIYEVTKNIFLAITF